MLPFLRSDAADRKGRTDPGLCLGAADVNFRDERYDGRTPDIIDNGFVVVDFDNGVRGMLELCMFAEGSRWQEAISVIGDSAKAEALVPGPARFSPDGAERASEFVLSPRASKIRATGDHQCRSHDPGGR
jgi:myo-inositol 2-dehydrogenase/D-chiro-inositol 1-dehydrogenase